MSDIRNTRQSELNFAVNPISNDHYYSIYDTLQKKVINITLEDLTKSIALNFSVGVGYTDAEREALDTLYGREFKLAVNGNSYFDGDVFLGLGTSIGDAPVEPFGVAFDGNLHSESLTSINENSSINFINNDVDFVYGGVRVLTSSSSGVLMNPDKTAGVGFKILGDGTQVSTFKNETAFHITEKGDLGVGTDEPRADLELYLGRVILGSKDTTEVHATEDCLSMLGGKAVGVDSVSIQDSEASGEKSFAVNGGNASGERSFAANLGEAEGVGSAAFNFGLSDGLYSFSVNSSYASGESSFSCGGSSAIGLYSFAGGRGTNVEGASSLGVGQFNNVPANLSFVGGSNSEIDGSRVLSFGFSNTVSANVSEVFIFGSSNTINPIIPSNVCSIVGSGNTITNPTLSVSNSSIMGTSNVVKSSNSGVLGFSNTINENAERSIIVGRDSETSYEDTISIGVGATADQHGEHSFSNLVVPTSERGQASRFFLSLDQDGYPVSTTYPMTTPVHDESIWLRDNGMYDFEISIVGRGCLKYTSRVIDVGDSTNWQFKIKGSIAVDQNGDSDFSAPPYVYSTPMSTIFGTPINPSDPYQPTESYFLTKDVTIKTPNQFCEVEGIEPYVRYIKGSRTLDVGIVRSRGWDYYDISQLVAGNQSSTDTYNIDGSLLIKGLDTSDYAMDYDLIVAIFNRDQSYLDSIGAELNTSSYIIKNSANQAVSSVGIDTEGAGFYGQSDLGLLVSGTGFNNICFGSVELDFNAAWHAVVDINKRVSSIATDPSDEFELNCNP